MKLAGKVENQGEIEDMPNLVRTLLFREKSLENRASKAIVLARSPNLFTRNLGVISLWKIEFLLDLTCQVFSALAEGKQAGPLCDEIVVNNLTLSQILPDLGRYLRTNDEFEFSRYCLTLDDIVVYRRISIMQNVRSIFCLRLYHHDCLFKDI